MKKGKLNTITDVEGVKIGHVTLNHNNIQTGVTAILGHGGNLFQEKLVAGGFIINGFGKSTGLGQLNEMGTLETPIILTNTLSVGTAYQGLVKYMLKENGDIGETTGTVNPIICECNDSYLNDTRGLPIQEEHIFEAITKAETEFRQGAVGAGRGMMCHQLKGGIGSSSRIIEINDQQYILGTLVLSNHGLLEDLRIDGQPIIKQETENFTEKGSIVSIIATDIPLTSRQLQRLCKRVPFGLARSGSFCSNGSGEIALAFSTAHKIPHYPNQITSTITALHDDYLNPVFLGLVESIHESVMNSLNYAETVTGKKNRKVLSLKDYINS